MADEDVRAPRAEVVTDERGALSEVDKVEQGAGQLLHDIKSRVEALFQSGKVHLAADLKNGWDKAKADALAAVESNAPEVKAAVEQALAVLEKFVLDTIESHLA